RLQSLCPSFFRLDLDRLARLLIGPPRAEVEPMEIEVRLHATRRAREAGVGGRARGRSQPRQPPSRRRPALDERIARLRAEPERCADQTHQKSMTGPAHQAAPYRRHRYPGGPTC